MDIRKSIVKTVWLTILTMILLTLIASAVFVFVFTKQCADFMYDIGCNNIASILYHKSYEDKGDIGDCYKAKGYIEEAILWLSYAIEETPNIREVYYDLGSLYLSINDFENARINLTKALNITIKNPNKKNIFNKDVYKI